MQYFNKLKATGLSVLAMFALSVQTAMAAGTASSTPISNTATVDYQVGGVSQTQLTSNSASFVVDNRVDLTVAEDATTYVDVAPGAGPTTGAVISFTVTNTGNTTQDYALSAAANGTDPFGGTDNFDATGVTVFVEDGTNAGYQVAEDTATFIDELAADASATVYVVGNIPLAQANGDIAAYTLTAVTHDAGAAGLGALTANDSGIADDPTTVEVVFADTVAGDTDGVNDGAFSDTGAFRVVTTTLTVTKAVAVVSDPINNTTNPKAIPGATMRYTITVNNTGATNATSVTIEDTPPGNTTYAPGTITVGGAGRTDAADGDDSDYNNTTAGAVTTTIATLAGGGSVVITFDVTID